MGEDTATVVVERVEGGALEARTRDVTLRVGRASDDTFRSVELLLAALGSCMLGTMLVFAENVGVALDGVRLELGASVGIASFPEHGHDVDVLMQRADVAMYQAKEGRTGVERYVPELDGNSVQRLALAGDLRTALERDPRQADAIPSTKGSLKG